ncbi:MAG: M15 family metallopeptidase [Stenotrophomonas sp.]
MHRRAPLLINTEAVELWPAALLRARSNLDARLLARARWVLRRKRDGRYLAAVLPQGVHSLVPHLPREPDVDEALALLEGGAGARPFAAHLEAQWLPLAGLQQRLQQLGLDAGQYAQDSGLALEAEPCVLHFAGRDRFGRPLWLRRGAAQGWRRMRLHAARDGVALDAISGFRSHAYQLGIFERKLARGLGVADILKVNAAPGFSEHHSGHALDIGTPGDAPAEETFEATDAFAWLQAHAGTHGFSLSYPRDNPHGIVYEPWHWCWNGTR